MRNPIYPNVMFSEFDDNTSILHGKVTRKELVLDTNLRIEHEGVFYLLPIKERVNLRKDNLDHKNVHMLYERLSRAIYLQMLFGNIEMLVGLSKDKDVSEKLVFKDIDQRSEKDRLLNLGTLQF